MPLRLTGNHRIRCEVFPGRRLINFILGQCLHRLCAPGEKKKKKILKKNRIFPDRHECDFHLRNGKITKRKILPFREVFGGLFEESESVEPKNLDESWQGNPKELSKKKVSASTHEIYLDQKRFGPCKTKGEKLPQELEDWQTRHQNERIKTMSPSAPKRNSLRSCFLSNANKREISSTALFPWKIVSPAYSPDNTPR